MRFALLSWHGDVVDLRSGEEGLVVVRLGQREVDDFYRLEAWDRVNGLRFARRLQFQSKTRVSLQQRDRYGRDVNR